MQGCRQSSTVAQLIRFQPADSFHTSINGIQTMVGTRRLSTSAPQLVNEERTLSRLLGYQMRLYLLCVKQRNKGIPTEHDSNGYCLVTFLPNDLDSAHVLRLSQHGNSRNVNTRRLVKELLFRLYPNLDATILYTPDPGLRYGLLQ